MKWTGALIGAAGVAGGFAAMAASRRIGKAGSYDLSGKGVLITGGSRGLGLQLAREFGAAGARIGICARDEQELERARQKLATEGIPVEVLVCDLIEAAQIERMIAAATQALGAIDILVNNAGVIEVGPLESMSVQDFEAAMAVMFWGPLHTTLAVLPGMKAKQRGRIVNITSIGGKVSVPHLLPYSCAKFAATALSEGLRSELAPYGIKVVTIIPGLMRTGSHLQAKFKGQQEREYAWFSLGAASPAVSISVDRAAREIVKATKRGDAEKILSVPADILARLHGAFPELVAPMLELVNQYLLPAPSSLQTGTKLGQEARRTLSSRWLEILTSSGNRVAGKMNETSA